MKLTYSEYIVTLRAKRSNCGEIAAFIREKTHWLALLGGQRHNGFVGNGIRGVVEGRPDVLGGQPWIRVE